MSEKDPVTEALRKMLVERSEVIETGDADLGLTTLSFQSVRFPNRHVWVDIDLDGETSVDLEDWDDESEWDNAVAHLVVNDLGVCSSVILAWLNGEALATCKGITNENEGQ